MTRRETLALLGAALPAVAAERKTTTRKTAPKKAPAAAPPKAAPKPVAAPPNVILLLADDLGWGDVSYNGHPVLRTPNLDAMAKAGVRFDRFYANSPVCSPTRGGCLTGRHPFRYGVFFANADDRVDGPSRYALPRQESTLAEVLKGAGYRTGFFGKWHLGDFSGPKQSSPADNGFEQSFATLRKTATLDPTGYFLNGKPHSEKLAGDDSRILMDRSLQFIREAVDEAKRFFCVVWFHTPHLPVLASAKDRARFSEYSEKEQHYWGAVTAMDAQIGRLRAELRKLEAAGNTMLWFASDNGPEGDRQSPDWPGSAGKLRGRKRSLFEGGVRVPALLEWPDRLQPRVVSMPCSTLDYYPTILSAARAKAKRQPQPLDGVDILPLIDGKVSIRPTPLAFETQGDTRGSARLALIENRYKLLSNLDQSADTLYDLEDDPAETRNVLGERREQAMAMRATLGAWRESCKRSLDGADYPKEEQRP